MMKNSASYATHFICQMSFEIGTLLLLLSGLYKNPSLLLSQSSAQIRFLVSYPLIKAVALASACRLFSLCCLLTFSANARPS